MWMKKKNNITQQKKQKKGIQNRKEEVEARKKV